MTQVCVGEVAGSSYSLVVGRNLHGSDMTTDMCVFGDVYVCGMTRYVLGRDGRCWVHCVNSLVGKYEAMWVCLHTVTKY